MEEFKSCTFKTFKGSVENTEWWTDKDWEEHAAWVEKLKASGEYMKEVEVTVHYKSLPQFDSEIDYSKSSIESSKLVFLNFNKDDTPR